MDFLQCSVLCLATFLLGNWTGKYDSNIVHKLRETALVKYKDFYIKLYYNSLLCVCLNICNVLKDGTKHEDLAEEYIKSVKELLYEKGEKES